MQQHIKRGLATQIRMLRDARGWTQARLAREMNSKQSAIARLEDEDYGQYTLQTLQRLASTFDVALMVRFVSFSDLMDYTLNVTAQKLVPAPFDSDERLAEPPRPTYRMGATRPQILLAGEGLGASPALYRQSGESLKSPWSIDSLNSMGTKLLEAAHV